MLKCSTASKNGHITLDSQPNNNKTGQTKNLSEGRLLTKFNQGIWFEIKIPVKESTNTMYNYIDENTNTLKRNI